MRKKKVYKTINWSKYNKKKCAEGDVRLFFTDDVITAWYAARQGERHRPYLYSGAVIQLSLIIRTRFCRNLRSTQGYISSMLQLMGLDIATPNYTTMCRRMKNLTVDFQIRATRNYPLDLVLDSTGLKAYGRGEWKTKQSDRFNVKQWKMMHLGMNPNNFQIEDVELTTCKTGDGQVGERIIKRMNGKLGKVYGDKAYSSKDCFNAIAKKRGTAVIDLNLSIKLAPDKKLRSHPGLKQRNNIFLKSRMYGVSGWKERSGYHRRSLIECQMNRFKLAFGESLASRKHCNQLTEVMIKAMILNIYASLGMPKTIPVT